MATLVIKVNAKHGRLAEFVKCQGDEVSVGRGLANDIVVPDSYVDSEQIVLSKHGEVWKLRVMSNTNPVLLNGEPLEKGDAVVNYDDELIVGQTHLTLLSESSPVATTRRLRFSSLFTVEKYGLMVPLLLLLSVGLIQMFYEYLGLIKIIKWGALVSSALGAILVVVSWAAVWALIGRLLRHQPHFFVHLFYSALVFGILIAGSSIDEYAGYMSNSEVAGEVTLWLFMFLLGSVLLRFNLSQATNLHNVTIISLVFNGCLLLLVYAMGSLDEKDFQRTPQYSTVVKPPFAHWSNNDTEGEFLMSYRAQFDKLEKE